MRLEKLEIRLLPGIDTPFTLEGTSPQVNLVTGPNAVGKSSLIRALRLLFGEKTDRSGAISVSADFRGKDALWTVHRNGSDIVWERDGVSAEKPPLPEVNQLSAYWLSLEDLIQADQPQADLIAELRRELSGGYDVIALREDRAFSVGKQHGKKEEAELRDARKRMREVVADYEVLQKQEKTLPTLEKKIASAKKSSENAKLLKNALQLLEYGQTIHDLELKLAGYSPHMDSLRGDERELLSGLENRKANLLTRLDSASSKVETAQKELWETALADKQPARKDMDSCRLKLDKTRELSAEILHRKEALEKAQAAKKLAQARLGDEDGIPQLDPDSISGAEKLAGEIQIAQQSVQLLEDELEECVDPPDPEEIDRTHQAGLALRSWLASSSARPVRVRWAIGIAFIVCTVMMILAALARAWPLFWGEFIAFFALVWVLLESSLDRRMKHEQKFEEFNLRGPEIWDESGVENSLREIDARIAALRTLESQAEDAGKLRKKRDKMLRRLTDLKARRAELAEKLGFDPGLTVAAFSNFILLAGKHQEACIEIEALEKALERLEGQCAESALSAHDFLAEWGAAPGPDYTLENLQAYFEDLRRRRENALQAVRERQDAEKEIEGIENAIEEVNSGIVKLFETARLEQGDSLELNRRLDELDAWKKLKKKHGDYVVLRNDKKQSLENKKGLMARIEDGDEEGLRLELENELEAAAGLEALQAERTRVQTLLNKAGANRDLEKARARVDMAASALEEKYEQARFADIGNMLLDAANEEYQSVHEPGVLKYARELFQSFTRHQFDMEFDSKTNRFRGRDLAQERSLEMSELSSATRMQLLLATRIARARQMEGAETLPMFLDESLTSSDEQRFGQVAESLEKIAAEEDRQVFYMGARRHEADLWEQMTQNRPHHIDLAEVRFGAGQAEPSDFQLRSSDPLPSPAKHSAESYAALLRVPPVNPRQPAGRIHLFHLLRDDLNLLHSLMQDCLLVSLGPLEAALRDTAAVNISPDPAVRERLDARCSIAKSWVELWRQGRGKLVDRSVLERASVNRSGIISDNFIDEVTALANKVHGVAESLITALENREVVGFLTRKTEDLKRYFEDEGYIDQQETLTMEEREQKILMRHSGIAKPKEIRRMVRFLESGLQQD
jgi:uncharacterized protein YhaN